MLIDRLIDNRTGYAVIDKPRGFFDEHPNGEGNSEIFAIVELDLPDLSMADCCKWIDRPMLDDAGKPHPNKVRVPLKKYNVTRLKMAEHRIERGALRNKISKEGLRLAVVKGGDYEADLNAESIKYDTLQNAVLEVGSGKTHATIGAAVTASSSGDHINVFAGTYTEIVSFGSKVLSLTGMVANQGVIIQNSTGVIVSNGTNSLATVVNFTIQGSGGTPTAAIAFAARGGIFRDLKLSGCTLGIQLATIQHMVYNTVAFDCGTGFNMLTANAIPVHCTAVDNTGRGFSLTAGGSALACRSVANGTDYFSGHTTGCTNCLSGDGTEPGVGGAATAVTGDFTDYASDDFTLKATATSLSGSPFMAMDAFRNVRKDNESSNILFPGWHDPDPKITPIPTAKVTSFTATAKNASVDLDFTTPLLADRVGMVVAATLTSAISLADGGVFTSIEENLTASTTYLNRTIADLTNGNGANLANGTLYNAIIVPGSAGGFLTGFSSGDEDTFTPIASSAGGLPVIDSTTPGNGEITANFTASSESETVYLRYRKKTPESAWSTQSALLSKVGSGSLTITGLDNFSEYEVAAYQRITVNDPFGDWDIVLETPILQVGATGDGTILFDLTIEEAILWDSLTFEP